MDTLAAALERLYWNAATRGPLLIVAPECYTPLRKPDEPPPDIFRFSQGESADDEEPSNATPATISLPAGPLNPTVFFPRFGLQTIKLSGLTVAEPTRMHVPQAMSLSDEQQEGLANPNDTLMRFLATLTESQWKAIGSAEGLGVGLLESKAQKKLFQQLLPARATVFFPTEPSFPKGDAEHPARLPASALADPHLRIYKSLSLTAFTSGGEANTFALRDRENTDPKGKLQRTVLLSPEKDLPEEALEPFGLAPTRLKPTQLDPASAVLNPLISLEGATTVGELVGRIARATHLNLLCDSRVAGRSVAIRGRGTVRAGTVLAGLCRGLQGAVRKLDSTYLLTAQVATNIEINEAVQLASDGINKQMSQRYAAEAAEALQARGQLIRSRATENVPRDSRSLASEALWKLGEKLQRPGDYEDEGNQPESVPLASLPSFFQQQVQTSYQKRRVESEKLDEPNRHAPTQVGAKVYLFSEVLLPNLRARATISGILPLDLIHPDTPLPQPPPPVRWPKTGVRGWYVPLPADDQESEALITLAKACGVTELRIALPPGTDSEKRLALLAVKLKAAKLLLVPVLCPFEAATAETKRDIDLLGRTAKEWSRSPAAASALEPLTLRDYAEPEAIDLAAFTASCLRLTSLPGVTALALAELAPPGYGSAVAETAAWAGGGQQAERLAFLQKEKLDPADVEQEDDTSTPEEQARWWQRKETRRDAFLLRLDVALKAARLSVPISAEGNFGWERWRPTIMKPANHSEEPTRPPQEAHPLLMAISLTDSSWKVSDSSPYALLDETGQRRLRLQKYMDAISNPGEEIRYDGIVLDISDLPLKQGLKLLESAFQDKPKPVPAD